MTEKLLIFRRFKMNPLIVGAIIAGAVALTGTIADSISKGVTNKKNIQMQEDINEQNVELANTELQRKKEDAIAAGYSPLAALGANGFSSALLNAPVAQSADYSGLQNFASNAFSALMNKDTQEKQLSETTRHNMTTETLEEQKNAISKLQIDATLKNKLLELNNALTIARESNATQEEISKLRIAAEELMQDKTLRNNLLMQNKQLAAQARNLEKEMKNRTTQTWINNAFGFLNNVVSAAANFVTFGK